MIAPTDPRGRKPGPTTVALVDVFTTDGGWLRPELAVDWVHALRPDWKRGTIERTLQRLREKGVFERRYVPDGMNGRDVAEYRATDVAWQYASGELRLVEMGEQI